MAKVLAFLGALIFSVTVLAAHPNPAPKSNAGFDKMKTLVGTWQSTSPDGGAITSLA